MSDVAERAWTREGLIDLVRETADLLGRTPVRAEIQQRVYRGHHKGGPISEHFGGYWELVRAAGLEPLPHGTPKDAVAVEVLQGAFGRSGLTSSEVARRLGWWRTKRRTGRRPYVAPDASRLMRTLGLRDHTGRGGKQRRRSVSPELAERLLRAMDVDPREAGL